MKNLRFSRLRYAVDLNAYYGEPAVKLTDEQVTTWLALRSEFEAHLEGKIKVRVVNPNALG